MTPRPVVMPIKLSPEESMVADKFFSACDGRAEGFRLGMEQAKQMFLQYLISQRTEVNDA